MHQLRIIDMPDGNNESDKIEVRFESDDKNIAYTIDYFHQGFEEGLKTEMNWFYNNYMPDPYGPDHKRAKYVLDDIAKLGKAIGAYIFGNEQAMAELNSAVKDAGIEYILLTLESKRFQFFLEPWELMVLPWMTERLAISCAGFIRRPGGGTNEIKQLACDKENPLRVLVVNPRPLDIITHASQSKLVGMISQLTQYDGYIEVEFLANNSWESLQNRLADSQKPVHIVHYDGCREVTPGDSAVAFVFENTEQQAEYYSVSQLSALLIKNNVYCITLDSCSGNGTDISRDDSLHMLAAIELQQAGMPHVISMWHATGSYTTAKFFQLLYAQLAEENSLAKAVVKTGFYINDIHKQEKISEQFKEYNDWPLALHFGSPDIRFFQDKINNTTPLTQTKTYTGHRGSLYGFKEEFLYPQFFWGRDRDLAAIEQALRNKKIPVVAGPAGIGKTHLLHHYAYWSVASGLREKAFYYDYNLYGYDKKLINQVLTFATHGNTVDPALLNDDYSAKNYLLILDNVVIEENNKDELVDYLLSLRKGVAQLIINYNNCADLFTGDSYPIWVKGLRAQERRQLGSALLQEHKLGYEEENSDYFELLDYLRGYPYMTQTIIPQMKGKPVAEIKAEFDKQLANYAIEKIDEHEKAIEVLFAYGWENIAVEWRPFLYPFADYSGFISDALPIAIDMKDSNEISAGDTLYELLGMAKSNPAAKILQSGVNAGLLSQKPFGKMIHPSALGFIRAQREQDNWTEAQANNVRAVISKIFCYELRVLAPFMNQNPHPFLYQQIVESQNRWFQSFEVVWNNQEYQLVASSIYLFRDMLARIGIKNELDEWALRKINEYGFAGLGEAGSREKSITWLVLANEALNSRQAADQEFVKQAVVFWDQWVAAEEQKDSAVLNYALMFLESFYRTRQDWQARKELGLKSYAYFAKNGVHDKMITALQAIARSEEALGNLESCISYENRVLHDIAYEQLENGIKQKAYMDIALCKLHRKDFINAQQLLDEIKAMPGIPGLDFNVNYLQGEIFYRQDLFADAARVYSALWATMMKSKQQAEIESMSKKIIDLESKIGRDKFEEIFREQAPGMETPSEMIEKQKEIAEKYKDGVPVQ